MSETIYETLDKLGDEAFFVEKYNHHEFDNLWFDPDANCFYFYTGAAYVEFIYEKTSNNELQIRIYDINHVKTSITLSKFKRYYKLN